MLALPYDEPLYRPPSEARSLILQVTLGCSWNRCGFCEMYTSKQFRVRPEADVLEEIRAVGETGLPVRKVFLADGDAMVLSTPRLMAVLNALRQHIDGEPRVSCYAMPRQLSKKSPQELKELRDAGLRLVYVGVESGDDEVLKRIDKGETGESTIDGLLRAGEAGIKRSVMILNGLGGRQLAEQHAVGSARVLNATHPEFASVLVMMLPAGDSRFQGIFGDGYVPQPQRELLEEMACFIENTELENTIFRSDHASNYLVLKGILNRDKAALLSQVRRAIDDPENSGLRPDGYRGL